MNILTIITASYNAGKYVDKTADSIKKFCPKGVDWIVVDGGSIDNTTEKIKECMFESVKIISEPDDGIYDAWNKALKYIDSKWVLFIGMGDEIHPDFNLKYFDIYLSEHPDVKVLFGSVDIYRADRYRYTDFRKELLGYEFGRPKLPNFQGVLFNAEIFIKDQIKFDSSYRIAGDSKLLLQVMGKYKYKNVDMKISIFDDSGISNSKQSIRITKTEIKRLCSELSIVIPFRTRIKSEFYWFAINVYMKIPNHVRSIFTFFKDKVKRFFK